MQTDPVRAADPWASRLRQMASSMAALNTRIARLASDLGASLKTDHALVQVLGSHDLAPLPRERRNMADSGEPARIAIDPTHRTTHKWHELRGLLVLRYSMEARYVDEVGVSAARQIMIEAEERLVRSGFNPGDDGVDFERMY